jgi:predicted nucleic acid-binding Zn ribbon protein
VVLRDAVARVGKEIGLPDPDVLTQVLARWAEVVGEEQAQHSQVRSLRDGVLTVEVDASVWATPLRYQENEVRAALARAVGGPVADRLRVVVARAR